MKFSILKEKRTVIDVDDPFADIAQTERIGLGDVIIAAIIGVATWTLLSLWDLPMLHPSLWDDISVAAGVRPASHLVHGFFVAFATVLFKWVGPQTGGTVLVALGKLCLSCVAVVTYAALREMLAFVMRARPQRSLRRSFVMQLASIVGTVAFVANEPVWNAGHCLGETSVLIALTVLSLEFFFVFLRKGSLAYVYLCALFLGLLSAESPMAFVILGAFIVVNNIVLKVLPVFESPFFKPAVMAVSKWYITAIFVLAILIGIAVNCVSFAANGGLEVLEKSAGDLPMLYLNDYAAFVTAAASPAGWILWVAVCLAPFIVAIIRFPAAADEETFLPYATGCVFIACGLVAFSQVAPVPALWFWTHFPIKSGYLLSAGYMLTATTIAAAVTILGVDSLCRNHARLARQVFGQDDESDDENDVDYDSRISAVVRRTVVVVVPLAMVLAMLPDRMEKGAREALRIIKDGIAEIMRETGDAEYLFTDGNLDVGIELASHLQGGNVKCLPLVSHTRNSSRDIYLRTRGMAKNAEDLFSFKFDVGMGLRSWIHDKPENLKNCAVMMGFDLWKRDGKPLPPMGGMLSRPAGWPSEDVRAESVSRAHELANRILDFHSRGVRLTNSDVKDALLSIQWRLARMCTYRGEQADLAGDAKAAIAEADMAKRLNEDNETYKQLLSAMSRQNDLMMQRLTPREGLQLALVRADFTMGKMYAETILVADPENADANFAMGMFYVKERQLTRAEEYLKRCLIRRPNEPSIYNNLAMIEMELGKLDAAELNAKKALKIIPDSAAVQDTLKIIQAKREGKTDKPEKNK